MFGLSEFIIALYPLFKEIISTKVASNEQNLEYVFASIQAESICYDKIKKFFTAIWLKKLKPGGCVDRYVKDIEYLPYFVQRLLKINKNRSLLANCDTESIDYKLAVLSAIHFMNPKHTAMFQAACFCTTEY